MQSDLPDLVADTRIRVKFKDELPARLVQRFDYESGIANGKFQRRKEIMHVWKAEKKLGKGSYGTVHLHRCLTSEDQAEVQAVKKLNKKFLSSTGISFVKELETIAKFSRKKYHGLFVEYQGWYENHFSVFIAMEYIPHGDLSSYLTEPLPENEAREISFQVAEGLDHLHQNRYVHRDIKAQNIFVVRKSPDWSVKIGDFGFSKRMSENSCLQSRAGTWLYQAPEVKDVFPPEMDGTSATYTYSEKVDIWSLGILTFYMLFHDYPFTSEKYLELRKYINGGPFPFPPSPAQQVNQHFTNFILAALARVAPERPSAQELLVTNWMKQRASDYVTEMRNLNVARETTAEAVQNTSQSHQFVQSKKKEAFPLSYDPVENIATPSEGNFALDSKGAPSLRPSPNPTESTESDTLTQLKAYHDKGMFSYNLKDYESAEKFLLQAFEGRRAATGPESKVTLQSQSNLAAVYHEQSRFTEAESLLRAVFKTQRETLEPKHFDMIYPLVLLSETLESLGKDSQARALEEEIEEICKITSQNNSKDEQRPLGPEFKGNKDLGTAQSSSSPSSRSLTLKNTSSKGGVRSQYHSAFQMTQDQRAPALLSREKLSADRDCASQLFKERRFEEGVHLFEQILEDQTELLGRDDKDTVDTMFLLGRGFFQWGKYDKAGAYFAELLESRIGKFGANHEETVHPLQWLGFTRFLDEKYAEAVISLEQAAKGCEELYGLHHKETLESLKWLGRSLARLERLPQAESVTSRIFESMSKTLGPTHEDTLDAWFALIEIYYEQSRYQEAKTAAYRLLQIQRETLGPNHKSTIRSLEFIVGIFFRDDHGSDEQLETTFDDLSKCQSVTLGPTHKDTLNSLQWLGIVRKRLNKTPEAEEALYKASRGQKETLGIGHEETVTSLWWLAETLQGQGKYREEIDVRKDVVTGHLNIFGDTHEKTLKAKDELAAANEAFIISIPDPTENVWPQPTFIQRASLKMRTLKDRWDSI